MKNYLIHIKTAKSLLWVAIYTITTMKRYGYNQQNDFNVIYAKIVVGQIVGKIQIIQKIYEKNTLNKRIITCSQITQHSKKELIAMNKLFLNSKGELLNEQNSNYRVKKP